MKRVNQPGWITADIRKCMKLRDGSKKRGRHDDYKYYRNLTTKMVKDAKTLHYREYVKSNKDNPNKLAKLFDELAGKCKDNSVTSLIYNNNNNNNNNILTKDRDIANAFNCHFTNITSKYNTNVNANIEPDLSKLQEYVKTRNM